MTNGANFHSLPIIRDWRQKRFSLRGAYIYGKLGYIHSNIHQTSKQNNMNILQIKQIAIVDFLLAIGISPAKETAASSWYHAP